MSEKELDGTSKAPRLEEDPSKVWRNAERLLFSGYVSQGDWEKAKEHGNNRELVLSFYQKYLAEKKEDLAARIRQEFAHWFDQI